MTRLCTHCGINPLGRQNKLFCSRECTHEAQRKYGERICEFCHNTFLCSDRSRSFCSMKCVYASRRKPSFGPCPKCGKPRLKRKNTFCSPECASRRIERRPCAVCGTIVAEARMKYCSNKCRYAAKVNSRKPNPCQKCGKQMAPRAKLYCQACYATPMLMMRKHKPETIHEIIRLKDEGKTRQQVAKVMGMSDGQIAGICDRHRISFARRVAKTKPAPEKYNRVATSVGWVAMPSGKSQKPRLPGIPLYPREVWQWGMQLNLPLSKRGDINAVSAAMRREDPTHPGFRIRENVKTAWRI